MLSNFAINISLQTLLQSMVYSEQYRTRCSILSIETIFKSELVTLRCYRDLMSLVLRGFVSIYGELLKFELRIAVFNR